MDVNFEREELNRATIDRFPQATPRNPWQDNGRGELNEGALSPPPEKRPRSYSPPLGNHVEQKTDLQDSLLGQALEGGPTIHTTPTNNVQVRRSFSLSRQLFDTLSRHRLLLRMLFRATENFFHFVFITLKASGKIG